MGPSYCYSIRPAPARPDFKELPTPASYRRRRDETIALDRWTSSPRLVRRISQTAATLTVTDRHARGLLRRFLEDERERAAEVRRRRRRQPLQGAPTLRAAHHVLENLDKAWAPRSLASYTDTTPDGVARLGLACLETEAAWLADWPGIAARSFLRRYLVRPGDTIYRSKSRGFAAFSNHSLERVIQRSDNWRSIARELRVASLVANSRLHELAQEAGFRQMLVPGSSGVFVGDFDSSLPFIRFDTFLPINAAGRGRCDLLVELAGLLWIGDRYQALMPALFFSSEPNELMDEVLATYERHRRLLERAHQPGEDWFGLALAQKDAEG